MSFKLFIVSAAFSTFADGRVPLSHCPCLLGFSVFEEWAALENLCTASNVSVNSLLGEASKCGKISFKAYDENSSEFGYRIDESHWKPVLLHMLKEQMIQGLVGGEVKHVLKADILY